MLFIFYKLFIWKGSFLKEADYSESMSRVPGWGIHFSCRPWGWGIERQLKKKIANPGGCARGGMITTRDEPCIISCRMDHFHDVTQNCDFSCFSLKQKFVSMNRFTVPNLVNLWSFRKSVANSWKYESPKLPIFTKKCMPRGKRLLHFFVNIGNFTLSYFREFAMDFPETSQVN